MTSQCQMVSVLRSLPGSQITSISLFYNNSFPFILLCAINTMFHPGQHGSS